jgi:hypothetical protein
MLAISEQRAHTRWGRVRRVGIDQRWERRYTSKLLELIPELSTITVIATTYIDLAQ